MSTPASIDEYMAGLPADLNEAAAATRAIIDRHLAGATSAILWGHPTWSVDDDPVCYLRATAGELLFGFWNAGSLGDESGRLKAHGSIMGHAVIASPGDVDEALFAGWLRRARELVRPPGRAVR
jgi:hypothetical protein